MESFGHGFFWSRIIRIVELSFGSRIIRIIELSFCHSIGRIIEFWSRPDTIMPLTPPSLSILPAGRHCRSLPAGAEARIVQGHAPLLLFSRFSAIWFELQK